MALIGYNRTSTVDQVAGIEAGERDLKAAGCVKIWFEQVSSVAHRPEFEKCLAALASGDVLVVSKLDRLARSTASALSIVEDLERRGCGLIVLAFGGGTIDTRTATGKMMISMFAVVATFERDMMLERQKEGIAKAKADGVYKGRKAMDMDKADSIRNLVSLGCNKQEVADQHGVSLMTVYRLLKAS